MVPNEKMWRRKEVAGRLGVSVDTVSRLIQRRKLFAMGLPQAGGRGVKTTWLIPESAVVRMLCGGK